MPSVSVDISNDNALMQATVGELVQASYLGVGGIHLSYREIHLSGYP